MPAPRAQVKPVRQSDIEMLVQLVQDGRLPGDNDKQDTAASAAASLCSLACDPDLRKAIALAGGVEPLVSLAREGTGPQKANAAAALKMLAYNDPRNKQWIALAKGIAPLVALLVPSEAGGMDGDGAEAVADGDCAGPAVLGERSETAAAALCNLACEGELRKEIARAGAIAPLVTLLSVGEGPSTRKGSAAAALNNLAGDDENRCEIAKAGAIPLLVRLARDGTALQREQAEAALKMLAFNNDANLVAISKEGHEAGLAACGFV